MSEDKLTKFEIFKGLLMLISALAIYTAVSNWVLDKFWNIALKPFHKFIGE